jgi:hypothetical protein
MVARQLGRVGYVYLGSRLARGSGGHVAKAKPDQVWDGGWQGSQPLARKVGRHVCTARQQHYNRGTAQYNQDTAAVTRLSFAANCPTTFPPLTLGAPRRLCEPYRQ